jgi:hypothetical protein
MRIVITGQPGTKKAAFAEALRAYRLKQRGVEPTQSGLEGVCNKACRWFEVESKNWLRVDFLNFLTNYNELHQSKHWEDSICNILDEINSNPPDDCFLLIHTTFYRNGHFFTPISWDRLLLFEPDCIVTLIDDVYDMWQRIEDGPHDTHYSLDEILTWRSVEISNARALALNLKLNPSVVLRSRQQSIPKHLRKCFGQPIPHYVMSIKHSLDTFHRLIFERSRRPLIYASFPITRTRESQERIEDINSFRRALQVAGAIVVDPLTIDELRMHRKNKRWLHLIDGAQFMKYQAERWQIDEPTVHPPAVYKTPFAGLSAEQIAKTVQSIWDQVVDRDFRMVSQCERVIAYRPFYPESGVGKYGEPPLASSDGVTREIAYAASLNKAVWAFHPKCDWVEKQEESLFSEKEIWSRVRRFPTRTELARLDANDTSGLDKLLEELKKEVKK